MSFSSRCGDLEPRVDHTRRACLTLAIAPGLVAAQVEQAPEIVAELPGARLQGRGTLRYFGLRVYDAQLWAQQPVKPDDVERTPLALELRYARSLRGPLIAERSLAEMRRSADLAEDTAGRWLAAMKLLFPDVRDGDRITGVLLPGVAARFHVNGRLVGEVRDPEFARLFFGIWLSPRTSEPALRAALLQIP
jgi:hypothetical protein